MKRLVLFLFVLVLSFSYSCNKKETALDVKTTDNMLTFRLDEPYENATYIGDDKEPDPVEGWCKPPARDCVDLGPVVIDAKGQVNMEDFVHPEIIESYRRGDLFLEIKNNSKTNEQCYIFKDKKGDIVLVYDFKVLKK